MALPDLLHNWPETRIGLHQASQVIGEVRKVLAKPEPNWIHLGLRMLPEGVTTGDLPGFGEMLVHFPQRELIYRSEGKKRFHLPLNQHSQISLAETVTARLAELGRSLTLDRAKLTGDTLLRLDARTASDYNQVLNEGVATLEKFQRELPGKKTPVVVWPHGFDTSFLWFATDEVSEQAPHMSFGFSPASTGLPRPYIYSYAYPIPAGLTDVALPEPAHWHTSYWTGAIIEYDVLVHLTEPWALVSEALRIIHARVSNLLNAQAGLL